MDNSQRLSLHHYSDFVDPDSENVVIEDYPSSDKFGGKDIKKFPDDGVHRVKCISRPYKPLHTEEPFHIPLTTSES